MEKVHQSLVFLVLAVKHSIATFFDAVAVFLKGSIEPLKFVSHFKKKM